MGDTDTRNDGGHDPRVAVAQLSDHVALVELRSPPNNFLSVPVVEAVGASIHNLEADGCRAVVLAAAGKHFCAGADHGGEPDGALTPERLAAAVRSVADGELPVIAAVQGAAIGAGLGLACIADFRICAPEARFAANFSLLGINPGFGLTRTLPAIVGRQHALDLLYTGRRIDGRHAASIGLADRVVDLVDLRHAAGAWAAEIAAAAPAAQRVIRHSLRAELLEGLEATVLAEARQQERLRTTHDFAEGVRAVAERRPGQFTNT